MTLAIRGGVVVDGTGAPPQRADVVIEDGRITAVGPDVGRGADSIIEADDLLVAPGFIDPHTHIYLPFMGTFSKDTHETASKAALVGGTTMIIEMVCQARNQQPLADGFEFWLGKAQGKSACDFTFHQTVSRLDKEAEGQLIDIVKARRTLLYDAPREEAWRDRHGPL